MTYIPSYRPGLKLGRRSLLKATGASIIGLSFASRGALAEEEKRLSLYNFDTYIGETTLADFGAATGVEARLDLYADMDEMFAKLKSGNPGYDAIVIASDFQERMMKANMLQPLDHSKIPNMSNIDPAFANPAFDPGRKYGIPYMWGTVGIGYRKSEVPGGVVDSWKLLFESDELAGKISLLGDAQNVLGCALKYLGFSFNSTNVAELNKVKDLLIAQKKNIKVFADDNGQDLLASGEVAICQEWNGDIAQVMKEDDDLAYILPKEGANVWEEAWCIPTGAPHPQNAHAFLNFVMDAENGRNIADTIQYATPNAAARKLMPESYTSSPAIYPPAELVAKCEGNQYLGEEALRVRDEIWTAIQAA